MFLLGVTIVSSLVLKRTKFWLLYLNKDNDKVRLIQRKHSETMKNVRDGSKICVWPKKKH